MKTKFSKEEQIKLDYLRDKMRKLHKKMDKDDEMMIHTCLFGQLIMIIFALLSILRNDIMIVTFLYIIFSVILSKISGYGLQWMRWKNENYFKGFR